jgi:hypothetical protein
VAYGHGDREGRGLKHVRHELRRLLLGDYVTRFNPVRQLVGFANHELVYTATLKGARAVLSDEEYSRQRVRTCMTAAVSLDPSERGAPAGIPSPPLDFTGGRAGRWSRQATSAARRERLASPGTHLPHQGRAPRPFTLRG